MARERDSKFVIYQVLYIFVITVLAMKGASLDLGEVISKKDVVRTSVRDSLLAVIDSLSKLGVKFNLSVESEAENIELKRKISSLNTTMASLSQQMDQTPLEILPDLPEIKKEEPEKENLINSPLSESQLFIQNTWNIASNKSNATVQIIDPANGEMLASVAPNEQKKFNLGPQNEVLVKYGKQQDRIKVQPNKPPEIRIDKVSSKMNTSESYVTDLQRTTIFKVTISDERPDQITITYNGPINVSGPVKDSRGNIIYNVALKIASTEQQYDQWMDRMNPLKDNTGKYKVNFFFIAQDKITKDRVQVGDSFLFSDFSE